MRLIKSPKIFAFFAAIILLMSITSTAMAHQVFSDVPDNHIYHVAVDWANTTGVVHGYGDGTFRPEQNVTRAEFSAMLGRAMRVKPVAGNCFSDVANYDITMSGYVCALAAIGVVHGYGDGTFGPNDNVLLVQEISMLTRALQLRGCVPASGPDNGSYPNVQGGHRNDLMAYLTRYGGEVSEAPNPSGPLPGAYDPVNRGRSVNMIMNSFWNISQGFPC